MDEGGEMTTSSPGGTVYLLHFERPYRHARHYIGWTSNLEARLAEHRAGNGARLIAVISEAGIGWQLSRIWAGTRARERQLKNQGGAAGLCPLYGVKPRIGWVRKVERCTTNASDAAS